MIPRRSLNDVSSVTAPVWAGVAVVVGSHIDGHMHLVFHECDPVSGEAGELGEAFFASAVLTRPGESVVEVVSRAFDTPGMPTDAGTK